MKKKSLRMRTIVLFMILALLVPGAALAAADDADPGEESEPGNGIQAEVSTIELSPADSSESRRLVQKEGGDFTLNLVAVAKDENGDPVEGKTINWSVTEVNDEATDADDHVAILSGVTSQTDDAGTAAMSVRILDDHVGTAEIRAADPDVPGVCASIRFEVYAVAEDEEVSFELDNKDVTDQTSYPWLITLPKESEYKVSRTVPEGQDAISVDEDGTVLIKKATTEPVLMTDAITDGDGRPIDLSLVGKGTVSACRLLSVSYRFTGITIESGTEVFYAGHGGYVLTLGTILADYELSGEQTATIRWSSSDPDMVSVSGDGSVNAGLQLLKPGSVVITATITVGSSEYSAEYSMEVIETASRLAIMDDEENELSSLRLSLGARARLVPAAYDSEDVQIDEKSTIPVDFIWTSGDESKLKISSDGMITTIDEGDVTVTLFDPYGEKSMTLPVTVVWEVTGLIPDMSSITMNEDAKVSMKVSILPYNIIPEKYALTTSSDDPSIVEATMSGNVLSFTSHAGGKAQVTVTDAASGLSCAVSVNVGGSYVRVSSLRPVEDAVSIYVGDSKYLRFTAAPANYTDTGFEWKSMNPEVASVDPVSGEIDGISKGNAIVTLSAVHDGTTVSTATYSVLVRERAHVDYVNVIPGDAVITAPVTDGNGNRISAGETLQLMAVTYPGNALGSKIKWSSSNVSVATVDPVTGFVEAKSGGTAVITAQAARVDENTPGASRSVTITVRSDVDPADADTGRYDSDGIWIGRVEDQYYTGARLTPRPNVYYGPILLEPDRDYGFAYKYNVNVSAAEPVVTVKLKGNYSGTATQGFKIRPADVSQATVGSTTVFVKTKGGVPVEQLLKPVVTHAGKKLKAGVDYEVEYTESADNSSAYALPGKWGMTILGIGNYTGEINTYEYVVDKTEAVSVTKLKAALEYASHPYSGEMLMPKVTIEGLTEGEDYEVSYASNMAPGTATVLVKGIGMSHYGTRKLTFKILPNPESLTQCDLLTDVDGRAVAVSKGRGSIDLEYVKGGITPVISVYRDGEKLGKDDCSTSVKINLKTMTGAITIKGKGKYYKDSAVIDVNVTKQDVRNLLPVVDDFAYSAKQNAYQKNSVAIYDKNGKALKSGLDYRIVAGSWEAESDVPAIGSLVTVYVEGEGFYDGRMQLSFRVVDPKAGIGSAKVFFMDDGIELPQARYAVRYAGKPVCISNDVIVLKNEVRNGRSMVQVTIPSSDYQVIGYLNNLKPGTATVIVRGRGDYAGIRKVTYKIKK